MSYLRYLCLLVYSGVQHILCCVCVWFCSSCVSYVASFSGLFLFCLSPSFLLYIVVSNTYCVVFCLRLSSSCCVSYVADFSGLSIFDFPFGIP